MARGLQLTEAEFLDIAWESTIVLLKVSAPALLTAMAVGLFISILQTVTQLMETTLTFVPKVIATFIALIVFIPYMISVMTEYYHHIMDRILSGH